MPPHDFSKGDEFEQKFPLRAAHFGIGLRRGNFELLQWLNTFVYSVKNDGTLEDLSQKWRKAPLPPLRIPRHPGLMARFARYGVLSAATVARTEFVGIRAQALFGGLGLIPSGARPSHSQIFSAVHVDYKLVLNALGLPGLEMA